MRNRYFKFPLIIVLSLFLHFSSFSQQFEGGLMGGLLGSQVAGDPSSGYNKLGGYLGIFAKRQFTLKSAAQLEMYYIQKGARENPTDENGNFQYLLRINNIEIPLLYIFKINKHLELSVGIAYTLLIGTPYEEANYSTSVPDTPFNTHSATFILGIDYFINENLSATFRTNNSMTPIRPHASGASRLFNHGQYSDALTLGLAFHFNTSKN
jgi:hypothetical protein